MGMYDTINGEQVKCFPWVSLYHDEISYHGGSLANFGIGSEVPYKAPHYNYGKNFVIFDLNRYPDSDYCDYDYILHVIVDGKVKSTFTNEVGDIDWSINEAVVGYSGGFLNIHSNEDVVNYAKEQREYWKRFEEVRDHWNELFRESMEYFHGLGLLDKDSEERKLRCSKLDEIHKLMEEEDERIKPKLQSLAKEYEKWFVDTSSIDDLVTLGDYISAYQTELRAGRESANTCMEMISKMLEKDSTLYDRYVQWQGSDEYIKEFQK